MSRINERWFWAALLAVLWTGLSGGCGHELFVDGERGSSERVIDKYYEGDSALQTTASRKKASEMGFGYPSGAANQ